MAPLVPNCQWWTAAGSTAQDHMNSLYAFFAGTLSHWTLVEPVSVAPGTNITSFLIQQGTAPDPIQQVNIRLDAVDGLIKAIITPDGTATASTADGTTPSGFNNASNEVELTLTDSTFSNRGLIAEYPDAVLFLIEVDTQNYWEAGGHFGKIYTPFNSNDEDLGLTGHGLLGGEPDILTSPFTKNWTSNESELKVGTSVWVGAEVTVSDGTDYGGQLGGVTRFPPHVVKTSEAGVGVTSGAIVGFFKYLRLADNQRAYQSINFAVGSNQAWQHMNHSTSICGTVFLWNKTVVP